MRVRIAISDTAREIELEIDDTDAFKAEVESAISDGTPILWVTDTEEHRVGIPVAKIGYIDISPENRMAAGFR
jgi:hypothetical protein